MHYTELGIVPSSPGGPPACNPQGQGLAEQHQENQRDLPIDSPSRAKIVEPVGLLGRHSRPSHNYESLTALGTARLRRRSRSQEVMPREERNSRSNKRRRSFFGRRTEVSSTTSAHERESCARKLVPFGASGVFCESVPQLVRSLSVAARHRRQLLDRVQDVHDSRTVPGNAQSTRLVSPSSYGNFEGETS